MTLGSDPPVTPTTAGGTTTPPAVEITGLSKTFPGQKALDDVDLTIGHGEVHGLLGENGSGKSTLIKVLSGFYVPDPGGVVRIGGGALRFGSAADAARLGLRFVHQHLGIIDEMTAVENVALASGYQTRLGGRINLPRQAARTQALLDRFDAHVDLWKPLGQCRAIDRTVVAIARALDGLDEERGVLVLDEPTAALPPDEVAHLFEVIRSLTRRGVTTVYVSHRLDEIFELVDRVSVLRDGRLQGTRPIAELDRASLITMIVGSEVDPTHRPAHPGGSPTATDPGPARLEVRGLRSTSIAGLSFRVGAGEVLGIGGLLGSGREEVAAAVVGSTPSTVEELWIDGQPVGPLNPVRARALGVGLVPGNRQRGSAVAAFDLRENITLAHLEADVRQGRLDRRSELATALRWVRELDIRPSDPAKVFRLLSGGNQQKAILARWFNIGPRLLLVDEPTAGVDVGARQAIYDVVRAQRQQGTSFVVCSSDHEDLVALCDRVLVMKAGRPGGELVGGQISAGGLLELSMGPVGSGTEGS